MSAPSSAEPSEPRAYRLRPSVWVGVAVVAVYIVVVFGLQLSSGLPYDQWVDTAGHGIRAAVIPLAAGSALLIAFLAFARWDMVWKDPGRLPMSRAMTAALIVFGLSIVTRLAIVSWSTVDASLLVVVLLTGVLVGFAEETLFRGVFLRCLRSGGRTEASAALWTAVAFGLFHLPNVLVGSGATQVFQVLLAGVSGVSLYLFRRYRGLILLAMIAHGLWDTSAFLVSSNTTPSAGIVAIMLLLASLIAGIAALVSVWRHDRRTVVMPTGIVEGGTVRPR